MLARDVVDFRPLEAELAEREVVDLLPLFEPPLLASLDLDVLERVEPEPVDLLVEPEPVDFVAVDFDDAALDAVDLAAVPDEDAFEAVDLVPVDFAPDFVVPALAVLRVAVVDLAAVALEVVDFDAAALDVPLLAWVDLEAVDRVEPVALVLAAFVLSDFAALRDVAVFAVPAFSVVLPDFVPVDFAAVDLDADVEVARESLRCPPTTSLNWVPARKAGTFVFRTLTASPVRGLRAVRAARARFSKTPKPVMLTFSPLLTLRTIRSTTFSTA